VIPIFWRKLVAQVDGMSLRERVLIFACVAFVLLTLFDTLLIKPLQVQQKQHLLQMVQTQKQIKAVRTQLESLVQAKNSDINSSLRNRVKQLQQQLREGGEYLNKRRNKLVPAEKMGALLQQVLSKNGRLHLVSLETMKVMPLIQASSYIQAGSSEGGKPVLPDRQLYKHGVRLTVRGSYAELLQYMTALEGLPMQMFWGAVKMNVLEHPSAEMSLTLYTLSMDTVWLKI